MSSSSSDDEKPDRRLSEEAQMAEWKRQLGELPRSKIAPGDHGLYSPGRQRRAQRRLIRNGLWKTT